MKTILIFLIVAAMFLGFALSGAAQTPNEELTGAFPDPNRVKADYRDDAERYAAFRILHDILSKAPEAQAEYDKGTAYFRASGAVEYQYMQMSRDSEAYKVFWDRARELSSDSGFRLTLLEKYHLADRPKPPDTNILDTLRSGAGLLLMVSPVLYLLPSMVVLYCYLFGWSDRREWLLSRGRNWPYWKGQSLRAALYYNLVFGWTGIGMYWALRFAWFRPELFGGSENEEGPAPARGFLGIRRKSVEIPKAARTKFSLPNEKGLLALEIMQGGPADQAGVLVGDILLALSGKPIQSSDELESFITTTIVGNPVQARLLRAGSLVEVTMIVAAIPRGTSKGVNPPPAGPQYTPEQRPSQGQRTCTQCSGGGKVPCPSCRGQRGQWRQPLTATDVAQWEHCTYCVSSGTIACMTCGGSGRI